MKMCSLLHEFLDGDLSADAGARFERHLVDCPTCASNVQNWRAAVDTMSEDAATRAERHPATIDIERQRVEASFSWNPSLPWWRMVRWGPVFAAVAAVGCLLFVGVLFYDTKDSASISVSPLKTVQITHFRKDGSIRKATKPSQGNTILAADDERLLAETENARVGISPGGEIHLHKMDARSTELIVNRGTIVCDVSKRREDERFVIYTVDNRFTVEVRGTRFSVNYPGTRAQERNEQAPEFQVAVAEGVVRVSDNRNRRWTVSCGEQLVVRREGTSLIETLSNENSDSIGVLLSPDGEVTYAGRDERDSETDDRPIVAARRGSGFGRNRGTAKTSDRKKHRGASTVQESIAATASLLQIKQWIVEGQYEMAVAAIKQRLVTDSRNSELWRLLAESKRKSGRYHDAIDAYQKVVELAPTSVAMAARFKVGLIYQNRLGHPADAIVQFSKYLSMRGPRLLRAEALLHLGEAELTLGHHKKAREYLNEVIEKHGTTAAAREARRKLQSMP